MESNDEKIKQTSAGCEDAQTGVVAIQPLGTADCNCEQGTGNTVDCGNDGAHGAQPVQNVSVDNAGVDTGSADETAENGDESRGGECGTSCDRDAGQRLIALIESDPELKQYISSLLGNDNQVAADPRPARAGQLGLYELARCGTPSESRVPDDENTARVLASPRRSVWPF